jgi:hypothetical protein
MSLLKLALQYPALDAYVRGRYSDLPSTRDAIRQPSRE